jgi:hypothetical protein
MTTGRINQVSRSSCCPPASTVVVGGGPVGPEEEGKPLANKPPVRVCVCVCVTPVPRSRTLPWMLVVCVWVRGRKSEYVGKGGE